MPDSLDTTALLARFVESFPRFDDMLTFDPVPTDLLVRSDDSDDRFTCWHPAHCETERKHLLPVYQELGEKFPPLFEQLVLSFRWLEVELEQLRLLANLPDGTLKPLRDNMLKDRVLNAVLIPQGFIRFAMGPDTNYDPVCFDTRRRGNDGDCPIVRIEHESVLCNDRIGDSWELYPSFKALVYSAITVSTP